MEKEAIDFIKDNLNLIDSNDFGKFYLNIPLNYRGDVTSLLLEADIDPLKYLDRIPRYYLCNQKGIESVDIPNNIKFIENSAFSGCTSLTSVTIGDGVTSIGDGAFYGCNSLKTINYKGSKKQWNAINLKDGWDSYASIKTIHCIDGDIKL